MFSRGKGNKLFSKIAKISYLCTHSGTNFSYFFDICLILRKISLNLLVGNCDEKRKLIFYH